MVTAIASARALINAGNVKAALEVLRKAAEQDRPPFETRRALAEIYRGLNSPDQAGRWGIVLDGWTTPIERDRLARMIAASGLSERWTRAFLAIPPDVPDPAELRDVLILVPLYRQKFGERATREFVLRESGGAERFREASLAGFVFAVAICFVAVLVTYFMVVFGGDGARYWGTVLGGLAMVVAGVALVARAVAYAIERRAIRALLAAAGGIAVLSAGAFAQFVLTAT